MTCSLRSTAVNPLHRYYGAVRPWSAHRYFRPRGASTCTFSLRITDQVLKFRTKAQTRVTPPGWRSATQEFDVLRFTLTVWAFIAFATNTPAADFCCRVRMNLFSHESVTCSRSPEIGSITFHPQPPNLRLASLIDMGFAIIGPFARRSRLRSGSSTLARAFAPRFLHTPTSRRRPCVSLSLHLYQVVKRTCTSKPSNMLGVPK